MFCAFFMDQTTGTTTPNMVKLALFTNLTYSYSLRYLCGVFFLLQIRFIVSCWSCQSLIAQQSA